MTERERERIGAEDSKKGKGKAGPDGRVTEHPLEAGADVPRLGAFSRVAALLKHYLFGWLS